MALSVVVSPFFSIDSSMTLSAWLVDSVGFSTRVRWLADILALRRASLVAVGGSHSGRGRVFSRSLFVSLVILSRVSGRLDDKTEKKQLSVFKPHMACWQKEAPSSTRADPVEVGQRKLFVCFRTRCSRWKEKTKPGVTVWQRRHRTWDLGGDHNLR